MAHPLAIARQAGRTVLLVSALPTALFYVTMSAAGLAPAIAVTLGWYYGTLVLKAARKKPIVGAAMLGAALITTRAIVALSTGSAFIYFLQPVAGTVITAASLALTALAGRPLLERLAHDFVPVPAALTDRLRAAKYFHRASALWSLMYVGNAVGTVWLLTSNSLGSFLVLKTVLSPVLTGIAVGLSYFLLRRLLRREGVRLCFSHDDDAMSGRFCD